jgi:hypothetical protein
MYCRLSKETNLAVATADGGSFASGVGDGSGSSGQQLLVVIGDTTMSGYVQYWIHGARVWAMAAAPVSGVSQAWVDQGRRRRRGSGNGGGGGEDRDDGSGGRWKGGDGG